MTGSPFTWPSTATSSYSRRGSRTSSASSVTRTSHDGLLAAWDPAPWLFPGQSPGRPAVDIVFGARLHRYGINAHAGRNTGRLALAAELPASVLADLTGISISAAERWSHWAKRDWAVYVGQRAADDCKGIDSPEPAKQTR